ncbi:protease family c26 gamma-glutamyl hydrolase [Holotrichia oblita]|uniref:Protease family c26 gamma-glutamyl hydrolase n=1 Tax=Holotrichia oblita TaxID=644536 RepID=A0ACB9TU00_HOLOL|nr:protease family c26 gamma-glutamyl hydrolase [Holotrichia oblita]
MSLSEKDRTEILMMIGHGDRRRSTNEVLQTLGNTDVPIIGILSQETFSVNSLFPGISYDSFIAASYVKYLESAGARVVPIMIGKNKEYYKELINNTNGILFPGGATFFNQSDGYADAGQIIYDIALELNQNGDYYPIWGTCLGMELMVHVALGGKEVRSHCSATKISMPLEFKADFRTSKLFSNAPDDIVEDLTNLDITYNSHNYCLTEETFEENNLLNDWQIISTNKDVNDFEFISVFESKRYPFYSIQFHPEKANFEFKSSLLIPHTAEAIKSSQYFANFFIEEAKRNNHKYPDWRSEQQAMIYNYSPHFTALQNSSYLQLYMFKESDENSVLLV